MQTISLAIKSRSLHKKANLMSFHIADLQAFGTVALAMLGAGIAWGQWVTARSKLILDLYEKRRAVYSKFRGPIGAVIRKGTVDHAVFLEFMTVLDEAQFLFGRDFASFMAETKLVMLKMAEATSMLEYKGISEEDRMKHIQMRSDGMRKIAEFWPRLDAMMIPYMLMEQRRPWSISRVSGYVVHRWRRRP